MSLKKQKFFIAIFIFLAGMALIAIPLHYSRANGLVPCGGIGEKPCTVEDAFILVARVTNWLIAMAGLYAVYQIINHGFYLVISMGNEESITSHKGGLTDAVIGFVLVMMAFMFINTVVNFLLTRNIAVSKNATCELNLKDPLTYLTMNHLVCSNLPEDGLH